MKQISLSGKLGRGKFTLVDDEDYEWLNSWSWYLERRSKKYVDVCNKSRKVVDGGGRTRSVRVSMHRLIMGEPSCKVDHVNRDPLDNRRHNLRLATDAQSGCNRGKTLIVRGRPVTSRFLGVSFHKTKAGDESPWRVTLSIQHRQIFGGYFRSELDAAHHRDFLALMLYGEFANLNFPNFDYFQFEPISWKCVDYLKKSREFMLHEPSEAQRVLWQREAALRPAGQGVAGE